MCADLRGGARIGMVIGLLTIPRAYPRASARIRAHPFLEQIWNTGGRRDAAAEAPDDA